MNILIRNLPRQVTEENLKELFAPFGTVGAVSIVRDLATGESRGFGFVEMPDQAQAEAAIQALHHTRQFNERLRVKEANPKFGPDYWKNAPAEPAPARPPKPAFTRKERPGAAGGQEKFRGAGRERPRRFAPSGGPASREGRPPRRPFGERPYGGRPSGERGERPYRRFPEREGGKPGYAPRGERGFGHRRPEERPGQAGPGFAPREGRPRRPFGERPYGRRPSGERDERPYRRFPEREGGRPGYAPRGEKGFGRRRPEERPGQAGPRFAPRERRPFAPSGGPASREGRPPRRTWGERPHGGRPSGERGYGHRRPQGRGGHGHSRPRFSPRGRR